MIEILKNEEQNRLNQLIDSAERVVVCVHVGPDGDAIGSALAMQSILRRRGKQVSVVAPNRFPDNLLWLPGAGDVRVYSPSDTSLKDLLHQAQLFLVLDLNEPSRMREMEEDVMSCSAPKVMLDHHLNPSPVWDMAVSRPEMCATGEVICHLAAQMGWTADMRQEEAVCLYTSMMCDTGAFTYNSNRAEVYDCISMLLRYGIDKDRIYRNVFWTATVGHETDGIYALCENGGLSALPCSHHNANQCGAPTLQYQERGYRRLCQYAVADTGHQAEHLPGRGH